MATGKKNNSSKIIKLPTDFTGVSGQQLSRDEIRSRKKKRLKRRRAIRKAIISLFMLLVVALIGVVLAFTVFFKIDAIKVKGSKAYPQKIIVQNCGVTVGDSLLLVSEKSVLNNLVENLPYVGSVTITRDLPSTLVINVTDTKAAAAFINNRGSYTLIDKNGKVLDLDANLLNDGIPLVTGLEVMESSEGELIAFKTQETGDILIEILKATDKAGITGLTEINLTDTSSVFMCYDNRIKILIGPAVKIETKILRAASAIERENEINQYEIGVLDLRIDPNVYFKEGAETTAPVPVTDESGKPIEETTEASVETSENVADEE